MADLFDRLQHELDRRTPPAGLRPEDLLDLPDDTRRIVQEAARRGEATIAELAAALGRSTDEAAALLADLEAQGLLRGINAAGGRRYQVAFGFRRTSDLPVDIWAALAERVGE